MQITMLYNDQITIDRFVNCAKWLELGLLFEINHQSIVIFHSLKKKGDLCVCICVDVYAFIH